MKTIILAAFFLVMSACSVMPSDRFIYRSEAKDFWCVGPQKGMWYGDCEDYAFTKKREIGGEVWHVALTGGGHHAVVLKDGLVYDNIFDGPVPQKEYPATWLFPMGPDPTNVCPSAWSLF